LAVADIGTLEHVGRFLSALPVATVAGALGIYLSAAVDWYLVVPRLSGILGAAPCQRPGGDNWANVTKLWFFHRAAATLLVILCLAGLFGYMGATAPPEHGGEQAAWFAAAFVSAGLYYRFQAGAFLGLWYGLNPPRHVGDIVSLADGRKAYLVDVSVQGASYMRLEADERYVGPRFPHKKDGLIGLDRLDELERVRAPRPICTPSTEECSSDGGGWCTGVNWYCRCNPRAHD
jgi:hypothetical protein